LDNSYVGYRLPAYHIQGTVPVTGSGPYVDNFNDPAASPGQPPQITTYYSRRVDAGFQVGLGYRLGNALVRAGYSRGLTNPGVGPAGGGSGAVPQYANQAFQLSFAYLFWPRSSS
jgi:hypothetical protein